MRATPLTVLGAAGAVAVEAAGVCVASVLAAIDTASGKSYEFGSGVALTVIGFAAVAALGVVAVGLARARPWSRTPALITHLFVVIVGIYLLQGRRYDWGGAAVGVALAGSALLLVPPSLRALRREPPPGSSSGPPAGAARAGRKPSAGS